MDDQLYRQIIIDHYRHPHNFGELRGADAVANKNNPLCGDQIKIMVKLGPGKKLKEIKFSGTGCSVSRTGGSILTDLAKGKTVKQLGRYTDQQFIADLGVPITPARKRCALLALETLRQALKIGVSPKR